MPAISFKFNNSHSAETLYLVCRLDIISHIMGISQSVLHYIIGRNLKPEKQMFQDFCASIYENSAKNFIYFLFYIFTCRHKILAAITWGCAKVLYSRRLQGYIQDCISGIAAENRLVKYTLSINMRPEIRFRKLKKLSPLHTRRTYGTALQRTYLISSASSI